MYLISVNNYTYANSRPLLKIAVQKFNKRALTGYVISGNPKLPLKIQWYDWRCYDRPEREQVSNRELVY